MNIRGMGYKKVLGAVLGIGLLMGPVQAHAAVADSPAAAPESLSRVLVREDFDQGDLWDVNNPGAITFTGGKARIKGSGSNNRMAYKAGKINAEHFLAELDLTIGEQNTNSNVKIALKAADYDGDRLQLRFDFPNNKVYLESTKNSSWAAEGEFAQTIGRTYHLAVLVSGNMMTAYVDGTKIVSVANDEIAGMDKGYFVIAGQYPKQDFTVDNLLITTDERPAGAEYTVTLKTATDGVADSGQESAGGILTADKTKGYAGDVVVLKPKAKHGYIFDHYESFQADGSPTDGLMPITNHAFQLNEKFGNVTVVAHFIKRTPGKTELLYDDFGAEDISSDGFYKSVKDPAHAVLRDGKLILDAEAEYNYVLADRQIFKKKQDKEGYRISVEMGKGNSVNGTVQIMFKGSDDGIGNRYVLSVNSQGRASFRRFLSSDGSNAELKSCGFPFTDQTFHLVLEVAGNKVTFYADGKEMMVYEDQDSWNHMPDAAGLINMTAKAPVIFDNLTVMRIPAVRNIEVAVMVEKEGSLAEDPDYKCGAARADRYQAAEGEYVTLSSVAKAGYRLKEYRAAEEAGIMLEGNRFRVTENAPEIIKIAAVFEQEALRKPLKFYIDSVSGMDTNEGTTETAPWRTLSILKAYGRFVPGDQILLKRGSEFNGEALEFEGMGNEKLPIIIDAYGNGEALPRINGNGQVTDVISLFNQQHIQIKNLEITNTDTRYNDTFGLNTSNNKEKPLRAINVSIKDFGTASGISITDCYIHDINGNINLKWNGGIFFDVKANVEDGALIGVASKYDGILISGCTFERVDRSALKLVSSAWCNQWEANSPNVPVHWYPSTNVVVRNNYMEKIGGDGITVRDTDGALVEYNLVRDCRYQNTGYNVGIWPFEAANTVIQYNEVSDTRGVQDGQGLDCDHASLGTVMQYNYSHNNQGGFMLIMGGYPHTAPTVRYNISQNDRDKTFEFAQGVPKGTMIYNNTVYSDQLIPKGILYLSNTGAGVGVNDMFLFNNLFFYPEGQSFYGKTAETEKLKTAAKLYHNGYAGGVSAPAADQAAVVVKAAGLSAPGTAPESNDSGIPRTGKSEELSGYKLLETSPFIDAGITMDEAVSYFGGSELFDGRSFSPRDLFETAKTGSSIRFAMGYHYPAIEGVTYSTDFYGNAVLAGSKPDIGAMEYQYKHR